MSENVEGRRTKDGRYLPVRAITTLTRIDAGPIVNVNGKRTTALMTGLRSFTAS